MISSGIALDVKAVPTPTFPLTQGLEKKLLKLYLNDPGLLTAILYENNINAILKKYSTYAFAYTEVKDEQSADGGSDDSDKTSGTDTGDRNNLMLYFGLFDLVLLAIVVMLYGRVKKQRK